MATQAYCLCPRGSNRVRGIARGRKADEVLVTVQNDGVVCYSSARRVSPRLASPLRTSRYFAPLLLSQDSNADRHAGPAFSTTCL